MSKTFNNIYRSYFLNEITDNDVIGLVEPMTLKDLGEIKAKVDSGNGAYNVLHGNVVGKRGNNIIVHTIGDKRLKKKVFTHLKMKNLKINMI